MALAVCGRSILSSRHDAQPRRGTPAGRTAATDRLRAYGSSRPLGIPLAGARRIRYGRRHSLVPTSLALAPALVTAAVLCHLHSLGWRSALHSHLVAVLVLQHALRARTAAGRRGLLGRGGMAGDACPS